MNEERKQLTVTLGMLGFEKTASLLGAGYIRKINNIRIEAYPEQYKIPIYILSSLGSIMYEESTILPHIAKKTITRLLTLHAQCETDEEFFERINERPKNPIPFKLD